MIQSLWSGKASLMIAICAQCGREFNQQKPRNRLCSIVCRNEAHRTAPVTLACARCGKQFTRRTWQVKGATRHYCGRECALKDRTGTKRRDARVAEVRRCAEC